jgi:hypothetical protein
MRSKPEYICSSCGHIELKKRSLKGFILKTGKYGSYVIIILLALVGGLSMYNFGVDSGYVSEVEFFSVGGLQSFFVNNLGDSAVNQSEANFFKEKALEISQGCSDDLCSSEKIYLFLRDNFNYVEGTDLIPMKIWNEKEGDCDEMSFLYMTILNQLSISNKMQCNNNHCWVIVYPDGKKVIADLTKYVWSEQ